MVIGPGTKLVCVLNGIQKVVYKSHFDNEASHLPLHFSVRQVSLLPSLIFVVVFFINWIAVYYGTTYAIPFGTIVKIFLIWAFVSFPLAVVGTVLGRNWNGKPDFPCRYTLSYAD